VALLIATSREVITFLFTDAYAASAPIFALWSLTIALSVLQTDAVMRVHAQIRFLFFVNLLRLAVIVASIQALMGGFGLIGPVLATLFAMALAKVLHLWRMGRVMNLKASQLLPWPALGAILAVSVIAVAPLLVVQALAAGSRPVVLLIGTAGYGLTYVLLLVTTGVVTVEERASLGRWCRVNLLGALAPAGVR
jgi:hypothetical protein